MPNCTAVAGLRGGAVRALSSTLDKLYYVEKTCKTAGCDSRYENPWLADKTLRAYSIVGNPKGELGFVRPVTDQPSRS
jgi:hypothetical protein